MDCRIHHRIKSLRKSNGLTTRTLAKKINVAPSTISRWEKRTVPSLNYLEELSKHLNTTIGFLCHGENYYLKETLLKTSLSRLENSDYEITVKTDIDNEDFYIHVRNSNKSYPFKIEEIGSPNGFGFVANYFQKEIKFLTEEELSNILLIQHRLNAALSEL